MKKINNWTIIRKDAFVYHDTITPDLTVIDPTGVKKTLWFNGGAFAGHDSQFACALSNFCASNQSWADAGLDDRAFFVGAILNDYIK